MKLDKTLNFTKLLKSKLSILQVFPNHAFENQTESRQLTELEILITIFVRHLTKMIYHAENFISFVDRAKVEITQRSNQSNSGDRITFNFDSGFSTIIPDSIFFEFDSFVLTARTILDKNIHRRFQREFLDRRKSSYNQLAQDVNLYLLKPLLKIIRDEVTHLNHHGTSFGSIANFKLREDQWEMTIYSNFTIDGRRGDLIFIFGYILRSINKFVREIIHLLRDEVLERFGQPNEKAVLISGKYGISVPSLKAIKRIN
ncbi:hypothetical protein [Leptospira stimsonii]|uniref:Uncharacterized protein n=1 Tax=Leptospira stimsonii TaxID=2202203 RepID=A0A396YRF0_9LEPT|nr:hypothetical protein [Leptospira stimsonii]RHX83924.1 hypothetical protein DLM75_23565 [Leptospira stimsonii]